jgi:DNA-binding winged helix-turn-helix (wHTH) protein
MPTGQQWGFGPFRFDPANARLWQGPRAIPLTPRMCALLQVLLEHAEQLVPKERLFTAVWPDVAVSENTLKTYIWRLRQVLGDTAQTPRFLETVPRVGYRLCMPVRVLEDRTNKSAFHAVTPAARPRQPLPLARSDGGCRSACGTLPQRLAATCEDSWI